MRLASIAVIGLTVGMSFSAGACSEAQGVPATRRVPVSLIVQRPGGEALGSLKRTDFQVTQGGRAFRVDVVQPAEWPTRGVASSVPTRLLVVCDARLGGDPRMVQGLAGKLRPFFSRGWQVSMVLPDGTQTEYVSSEAELDTTVGVSGGIRQVADSRGHAAETLQGFPGRRVLLYVSTTAGGWTQTKVPFAMRKEAAKAMAQVYVVDGGRPGGSASYRDAPTYARLPGRRWGDADDMRAEMQIPYPAKTLFKFGRFHEVDLHEAIRHALKDAEGFYVLEIDCGSSACPDAGSPVSIHIKQDGPLRISAMGPGEGRDLLLDASAQ